MNKTDTQTKTDWTQFCYDQANNAALDWFKKQSLNNYASLYLYYRRGELGVFEEPQDDWTLGSGERLSPALTRQQVAAKIYAMAQRLPFLPV
jgi:hypothetical protein